MKAQEHFNRLPMYFDKKVFKLAETVPHDAAFYMLIGEYTDVDPDDDDTLEELCELIIDMYPTLEF